MMNNQLDCVERQIRRLCLLFAMMAMMFSGHVVAAVELSGEVASSEKFAGAVDFLSDESYEKPTSDVQVSDPIEPFNRAMFTVNDKFYIWMLEPVSTGYSKIVPGDIRACIGNFFYNLGEPVRSVNCLLQGRFRDAGKTLGRFFINSICGVFGLADPAGDEFEIPPIYASFGETLSVWGVGDGFYLVVPLLGPSTLRDFSGTVVDGVASATYTPWNDDTLTTATAQGAKTVNRTSLHLGEYVEIKSMSFDSYVAFRNGYYQMRSKQYDHSTSSK
ncbi:MAG: VacJ family lipoprotein [Desulfobulbus sp.]|jgi:phospholipid-binding lipoprotein MlaA|uniref:MlaA family lipoprotein n=1 Tax=Desulfobulbus sp. TaxID=895 RepID=UPI002847E405|nr:VacJ family lipoprotein [Desulfobulbus sp.]MDR2550543.1 VacJ family lipoprotein [Desulfobulbus sp.]